MARLPSNTMIPGGDEENPCVAHLLETAYMIGMNMKAGTDCDFGLMIMMKDRLSNKNFPCSEAGHGGLNPEVKKAKDTLVDYVDRVQTRVYDAPRDAAEASSVECLTVSNLFDNLVASLGITVPGSSISSGVQGQRSRDPKYLT